MKLQRYQAAIVVTVVLRAFVDRTDTQLPEPGCNISKKLNELFTEQQVPPIPPRQTHVCAGVS